MNACWAVILFHFPEFPVGMLWKYSDTICREKDGAYIAAYGFL